jgi:UDP-N-acetylmuramoyl-L-alanyl-D-glutamate--2,6-diaminopimelate ligase
MRLSELLQRIVDDWTPSGSDPEIGSIADDSRAVGPGALFVARSGANADGRTFVAEAVAKGAVAIVGAPGTEPPAGVAFVPVRPPLTVPTVSARLADRLAGEPTRRLRILGVTGTNGKTTIATLLRGFLSASDEPCGLVGTVELDDGRERRPSHLTTPGGIELAQLFARMVGNGCRRVAMEVSSHALAQERVAAIDFACGIFTNLTGDHLDYHGSMEAYAAAKAKLFESLSSAAHAVVNADDPWCDRVTATRARVLRCSAIDARAECLVNVRAVEAAGMRATLRGPWGSWDLRIPLVGLHNAMNALQAATAAWTEGVGEDRLRGAIESCSAPRGRLEPVTLEGAVADIAVLVDYAHTDDALLNVLTALRPVVPIGAALRVVFGCGGDRDRTKRPRMGAVACRHADAIVVTSDNPRTEEPTAIIADILEGVPAADRDRVAVEPDRAAAIEAAVSAARPGDVVVIAGKGHEDYQIVGRERRSFDDRLVAEAALRRRAERIRSTLAGAGR